MRCWHWTAEAIGGVRRDIIFGAPINIHRRIHNQIPIPSKVVSTESSGLWKSPLVHWRCVDAVMSINEPPARVQFFSASCQEHARVLYT